MKLSKGQRIALIIYAAAALVLLAAAPANAFGTAWSLLPPVMAIGLALITKEVYLSLFTGVLAGGVLAAGSLLKPVQMVEITFDMIVGKISDTGNIGILIFLVFLGTMVALINKAGGARAYGA